MWRLHGCVWSLLCSGWLDVPHGLAVVSFSCLCGVLHVVQVGPEVAKQLFEEHIERLKAREKDRKHKDDDDDGGGKKKKRSSRWVVADSATQMATLVGL